MTKKTAQITFIILNILAFLSIYFVFIEHIRILSGIDEHKIQIPFDSGVYYLLLMSVVWLFSIIQYVGLRNSESLLVKYANQVSIAWFIFTLVLANLLPFYIKGKLEDAGYSECSDPREISRVARGESNIYSLEKCKNN